MPNPAPRVYLIGALEENHNANAGLAADLVRLAAEAGCDAVAVRRWSTGVAFADEFLREPHAGATRAEVLEARELPLDAAASVRRACADVGIDFVAAPYDAVSLGELAGLEPDAYQAEPALIGQPEALREIASKGRPVYLVAGRCTETEIAGAIDALGGAAITVLHTVAARGISLDQTALGVVPHLASRFGLPVGYYGLEPGIEASIAALALGAQVIEKPFTTDHRLPGHGHAISLDRDELRRLAFALRGLQPALGATGPRVPLQQELDQDETGRATLVAARDLAAGEVLSDGMLETRLSGRGVSPLQSKHVLGKRLAYDVAAGAPITYGSLGEAS